MDKHTKALIEEYIDDIEKNNLVPVFRAVKDRILPIYWKTIFNELIQIFSDLELDTVAPRFECLKEDLEDAEYHYAEEIEEGYARNDALFLQFLNRYNVPRYGFSLEEIVKYVKAYYPKLNVYISDKWRVRV